MAPQTEATTAVNDVYFCRFNQHILILNGIRLISHSKSYLILYSPYQTESYKSVLNDKLLVWAACDLCLELFNLIRYYRSTASWKLEFESSTST